MKKILSLFDYSGVMVQPWLNAGYTATIVDFQHPRGETVEGNLTKLGIDIVDNEERLKKISDVVFVSAFPPCTDLAVSGARWFERKRKQNPDFQGDAMDIVYTALRIAESHNCPYFIENPISVMSTLWRKPDYYFHPYQYSGYCKEDNYTKKTCLWTNDKFVMPKPYFDDSISIDKGRIHKTPPGENQKNKRSKTPLGFARAVFYSNKPKE